jgi:hypothetical protein
MAIAIFHTTMSLDGFTIGAGGAMDWMFVEGEHDSDDGDHPRVTQVRSIDCERRGPASWRFMSSPARAS